MKFKARVMWVKLKSDYIYLLLLTIAFVFHYAFQYRAEVSIPLPPENLLSEGDVMISDLPVGPELRLKLRGAKAKKYAVSDSRSTFTVTLVDFSRNLHSAHSPELCMRGNGWKNVLSSCEVVRWGDVSINKFMRRDRIHYLSYFFVSSGAVYSSEIRFRLESLFSVYSGSPNQTSSYYVIIDFGSVEPKGELWKNIVNEWFCSEEQVGA